MFLYLDSWLLVTRSGQEAHKSTSMLLNCLFLRCPRQRQGIDPTLYPVSGLHRGYHKFGAYLPVDRFQETDITTLIMNNPYVQAKTCLFLLGHIALCYLHDPLHMTPPSLPSDRLHSIYSLNCDSLASMLIVPIKMLLSLPMVGRPMFICVRVPFLPSPDKTIITDSSLVGGGGHLNDHLVQEHRLLENPGCI